jgi:hypothetical protein
MENKLNFIAYDHKENNFFEPTLIELKEGAWVARKSWANDSYFCSVFNNTEIKDLDRQWIFLGSIVKYPNESKYFIVDFRFGKFIVRDVKDTGYMEITEYLWHVVGHICTHTIQGDRLIKKRVKRRA